MSEYIPSTEEVRDFISKTAWSGEEFDRWLEQVKAEAWKEGYVAGFLKSMGGELDGSARAACCRVPKGGAVVSGRIVYEPLPPTACERGMCEGKPKPENYRDGTIWQCDDCCAQWEKWSGTQYNEPFDAWRLKGGARV